MDYAPLDVVGVLLGATGQLGREHDSNHNFICSYPTIILEEVTSVHSTQQLS